MILPGATESSVSIKYMYYSPSLHWNVTPVVVIYSLHELEPGQPGSHRETAAAEDRGIQDRRIGPVDTGSRWAVQCHTARWPGLVEVLRSAEHTEYLAYSDSARTAIPAPFTRAGVVGHGIGDEARCCSWLINFVPRRGERQAMLTT